MGDLNSIAAAMQELSRDLNMEAEPLTVKDEGEQKEIIDLTQDDDEDTLNSDYHETPVKIDTKVQQTEAGSSSGAILIPQTDIRQLTTITSVADDAELRIDLDTDLTVFADDESQMSLYELIECLTVGELKEIARQMKIKATQNVSIPVSISLLHCRYDSFMLI